MQNQNEDGAEELECKKTLAKVLMKKYNYKRALQYYEEALEMKPKSLECRLAKTRALLQLGQDAQALAMAEKLIRELQTACDGTSDEALAASFLKAEALYAQGEFELALVLYRFCAETRTDCDDYRKGVQRAKEAIKNSIGNPEEIKLNTKQNIENSEKKDLKSRKSFLSTIFNSQKSHRKNCISKYSTNSRDSVKSNRKSRFDNLILGDLSKDVEFFEESLISSENNEDLEEKLNDCLTFLEKKKQFWGEQMPVYTRLHKINKIKSEREKCPLTPSFAMELAASIKRSLVSSESSHQQRADNLDKALRIHELLVEKRDFKSTMVFSKMLCNYFHAMGDLSRCLEFGKELCLLNSSVGGSVEDELKFKLYVSKVLESLDQIEESIKWYKSSRAMVLEDNKLKAVISYSIAVNLEKVGKTKEAKTECESALRFSSLCADKEINRGANSLKNKLSAIKV